MIRCERATVERSGRVVIESLSLAVAPGEALAVVGRTGAGKSSLLAAVATVSVTPASYLLARQGLTAVAPNTAMPYLTPPPGQETAAPATPPPAPLVGQSTREAGRWPVPAGSACTDDSRRARRRQCY